MKYFLSVALFLLLNHAQAQNPTNYTASLYWTGYYLEWGLSDRFQWDVEVDNRRLFSPSEQFQTIARTTLYYKPRQNLNYGAGIAYSSLNSIYSHIIQPEIRPHQEVNLNHGGNLLNINHRIRLEQRFREDTVRSILPTGEIREENSSSYSFDLRTRYEPSMDLALLNREKEAGHLNLQLAAEWMVQRWDEWFDTSRYYAGLQYFASPKIRLELGYMKSVERDFIYDRRHSFNNLRFTLRQRL